MIAFHGDTCVPVELCRLLSQTIPEEHHIPVVFHNRRTTYQSRGCRGSYNGHQIDIYLNQIFSSSDLARGDDADELGWSLGSWSTKSWFALLWVCYHEFGHVATEDNCDDVSMDTYRKRGREFKYVENLANDWTRRRLLELRDHDKRLGQPRVMTGLFGARLFRCMRWIEDRVRRNSSHFPKKFVEGEIGATMSYIKERRCQKTGGQLYAGDVLTALGLDPHRFPNAYKALKRVSTGLGIDYTDRAGRNHKLYTWGDIPIARSRLNDLYRSGAWLPREVSSGTPLPFEHQPDYYAEDGLVA